MPSCCSPNYFSIVCLILFFGTRSLYLPLFILVPIRSFRTSKTFDVQLWRENPYSLRFKLRLHSHSEVLVAIGNALRFIHQEGVLHRDVWSSKGYQRLHLHTEVACIFFVEATSNTHWPQRTHQNTYTKKHKKQKTKQKTHGHTHTHTMNTNKKAHAKTHCKTFRDSRWNLGTSSSLEKDSKIPALWRWLGRNRRIAWLFLVIGDDCSLTFFLLWSYKLKGFIWRPAKTGSAGFGWKPLW